MRILFVSVNDWANVGALMVAAIRKAGGSAECIIRHHHSFEYTMGGTKWTTFKELQALVSKAKAVVLLHSEEFKSLKFNDQTVAVFHGGTKYRKYWKKLNESFNSFVDITIIQTADFLDKGAKNIHWIIPPVDTDRLQPSFTTRGILIFAHHPSNPLFKGSSIIKAVMENFPQVNFNFDLSILPWKDHINRLRMCDVYIERMNLKREGYKTGIWGMSALEAAALGKIVITNNLWRKEYEKKFGLCPMLIANSGEELKFRVNQIVSMTKNEIISLKKRTRQWVKDKHSFIPVGKQLLEILLNE